MPETNAEPEPRGFPFITAIATLLTLFAFLGLMVLAYNSPNYLGETRSEPKMDPAVKLEEARARNQAVLEGKPGSGSAMSVPEATSRLLGSLKSQKDALPFPTPQPPPPPEPKKPEKK